MLGGVTLKLILSERFEKLLILLYLVNGWAGLAAIEPLAANLHWVSLALLGISGLLFSSGVAFHLWTSLRHHNVI